MSQRNPMNERYQGEGPVGKTKKSAAKLKPKVAAAASVHIEAKPTTRQERKAAHRKREAEEKRKAEERARKAAERERKAALAAGDVLPEPKKPTMIERFFPKKQPAAAASTTATTIANAAAGKSTAPAANAAAARRSAFPATKQYKDLRRIYWIMIAIGVVFVIASFIAQMNFYDRLEIWGVTMGAAYVCIIGAIILDFAKIKPLVKAHQRQLNGGSGKKSPKQIKHEEEAAQRAREIEEFNKAKKQARRRNIRKAVGLASKAVDETAPATPETPPAAAQAAVPAEPAMPAEPAEPAKG
jgi:hypothetical protein